MKERIQKRWKDTEGAFSILFVIIVFIGVIAITGFLGILYETWSMQEVQSIMDTSSVSALRTGVDEQKLRIEVFEVDKLKIEKTYMASVSSLLDESNRIVDYRFVRTKVETFTENWGNGINYKSNPQALIDSTIIITVETDPLLDMVPGLEHWFYDSRSNGEFQVSYMGHAEDGNVELVIRSVSRIVYR